MRSLYYKPWWYGRISYHTTHNALVVECEMHIHPALKYLKYYLSFFSFSVAIKSESISLIIHLADSPYILLSWDENNNKKKKTRSCTQKSGWQNAMQVEVVQPTNIQRRDRGYDSHRAVSNPANVTSTMQSMHFQSQNNRT